MSQYCNRCGRPHGEGECLRDKIAAALTSNPDSADEYALADDVITALGMEVHEYGIRTSYPKLPVRDIVHVRYVTKWLPE